VLVDGLLHGDDVSGCLITLYWGADLHEEDAMQAASLLTADDRDVEVEVHYGGQPFYQYIASLE
jgi:dihydroxyacetone kinase-like predicted kinase